MNVGKWLWDFTITVLNGINELWTFFTSTISVGRIEIFGVEIIKGFTFNPSYMTGAVMLVIVGVGLVSLVNPFS